MGYQGIVAPVFSRHGRPALAALALVLAGCDVPKEVNPVWIYDQVSGRADRARPPLPGLDQPFPNLASVPPRPEKPPLAAREQVSAALAEERARSREPLQPRQGGAPPAFQAAPGTPGLPAAPPPPPQIAGARPIPWDEPAPPAAAARPGAPRPDPAASPAVPRPDPAASPAAPRPGPAPSPAAPRPGPAAAPAAPMPGTPPAAPPPDLLGPPPLPPAELLAPAPARR